MKITELEELIKGILSQECAERSEQTFFSIGGRGYYENPASDVLAFFCDSDECHELGGLVIRALFRALKIDAEISDYSVVSKPGREIVHVSQLFSEVQTEKQGCDISSAAQNRQAWRSSMGRQIHCPV